VAVLNSQAILPTPWVGTGVTFDTALLAMAMAALGVTAHVSATRAAGVKPRAPGTVLFAWLVLGGSVINAGARAVFG
jgi:uncharacterized membrane protein YadS